MKWGRVCGLGRGCVGLGIGGHEVVCFVLK